MRFHSPAYLRVLREACDAHDVLLILDEIATVSAVRARFLPPSRAGSRLM